MQLMQGPRDAQKRLHASYRCLRRHRWSVETPLTTPTDRAVGLELGRLGPPTAISQRSNRAKQITMSSCTRRSSVACDAPSPLPSSSSWLSTSHTIRQDSLIALIIAPAGPLAVRHGRPMRHFGGYQSMTDSVFWQHGV